MNTNNRRIKKYNVGKKDTITYDFSSTHLNSSNIQEIKKELTGFNFEDKIKSLVTGANLNYTEGRPVLHYLLRSNPRNEKTYQKYFEDEKVIDQMQKLRICKKEEARLNQMLDLNENKPNKSEIKKSFVPKELLKIKKQIRKEMSKMEKFESKFDKMTGITGKPIKNIVNIGIGGSDLGPKLINDALSFYKKRNVYFFSNVDSSNFFRNKIDLEETLFIVVSKSWSTIETLENMKMILEIYKKKFNAETKKILKKHFVAVTSKNAPTVENVPLKKFAMWDFVGGRYSLWSCVGLSIVLGLGFDKFKRLLKGARKADTKFFKNPLESAAGMMAITEIFYGKNDSKYKTNNKCYVAYDSHLEYLYKYLQQAEMESNGKENSNQKIVWGGTGTDVQHSFFQYLHQCDERIYLEVLLPLKNLYEDENPEIKEIIRDHHKLLVSNCLAQTRALMIGKENKKEPWRNFKGNKASTTILYSKLTPEILGFLLATYEHKIFVEGVYWGINSFDQFGVELGKKLATEIYEEKGDLDEITQNRWEIYKQANKE